MTGDHAPELQNERGISEDELRDALRKILRSRAFHAVQKLRELLNYIVEQSLKDDPDSLKESRIAVDHMKRQSFDAQNDAIVRATAMRLRERLQAYYGDEGKNDSIIIEIPLRRYRAEFRRSCPEEVDPSPRSRDEAPKGRVTATRARTNLSEEFTNIEPSSGTEPAAPRTEVVSPSLLKTGRRRRYLLFGVWMALAAVIVVAIVVIWIRVRHPPQEFEEIAKNESAKRLTAIALSPDGERLAFADDLELCVREMADGAPITRIKFGELGSLRDVSSLAWSFEGNRLLLTGRDRETGGGGVWALVVGAGPPIKLADDVAEIATSKNGRTAWIAADRSSVFACKKELSDCDRVPFILQSGRILSGIAWIGPDAIVVGSFSTGDHQLHLTLETLNVTGSDQRTILRDESVTAFYARPDGRLLYSTAEPRPQGQYDARLWERRPGSIRPQLLRTWTDSIVTAISGATQSENFAIIRGHYSAGIYVGDVGASGHDIGPFRPLANADINEFPTAWTADSQRIIYHSDSLSSFGRFGLFSQGLNESSGRLLIRSPIQDIRGARTSPDGKWVVYYTRRLQELFQKAWMRIPVDGSKGSERLPLPIGNYDLRCPPRSTRPCIVREQSADHVFFFRFDLDSGRKQQIASFPASEFGRDIHWSIGPSGDRLAVLRNGPGHSSILMLSIDKGDRTEISTIGTFESLDWNAQETGWYASRPSSSGMDLMFISTDGHEQLVRRQIRNFVTWAVPSPDGRHLAVLEWTLSGKVYLLKSTLQ